MITQEKKYELRLKCMEIALIAVTKADINKHEAIAFAEKIWEFVCGTPPENKQAFTLKKGCQTIDRNFQA